MLAANEAVARWFGARELPTIYRVHGVPDEEKLQAFLDLAATHGFEVPELPVDPRALNALLDELQGHAQQRALNQLLLRAMMQAVYSPENIGHYGLAAEHYLHFTSPIRRYPDLDRAPAPQGGVGAAAGASRPREPSPAALEEMAALSSERERAAMEAEREIAAFYAALFMKDKVGERFEGVVSAVVEFGLFVELRPLVRRGARAGGGPRAARFELDPVQHALVDAPRAARSGWATRSRSRWCPRARCAAGSSCGSSRGEPAGRPRSGCGPAAAERTGARRGRPAADAGGARGTRRGAAAAARRGRGREPGAGDAAAPRRAGDRAATAAPERPRRSAAAKGTASTA